MIRYITQLPVNVYKKISSQLVEKQVQQVITDTLKLTSINQFEDNDIFVVGYPKSGNTWFRFLIAGAVYGIDLDLAPSSLVYDLIPDLHYLPFYKRFHSPMFFKSHYLPLPEYKHVIYLVRDGRDVMVSYFHHLSAIRGEEITFSDLVQGDDYLEFGMWHDHIKAWLQNPYKARLMITRYEDLITQPLQEMRRLCEFVGVGRPDSLLNQVIEKTSFTAMQNKENRNASFRENPMWPKNKNFFRRGQIGSHKDEMPSEFKVKFLEQAGPMLQELGYLKTNE